MIEPAVGFGSSQTYPLNVVPGILDSLRPDPPLDVPFGRVRHDVNFGQVHLLGLILAEHQLLVQLPKRSANFSYALNIYAAYVGQTTCWPCDLTSWSLPSAS